MRAALVALLLLGAPAAAQDCGGLDPLAAEDCLAARHAEAEAALTAAYAAAIDRAQGLDLGGDGGPEALLRAAERAWIAFRDASCEAESRPFQRAAAGPVLREACLDRITRARILDLEAYGETPS